MRIDPDQPRGLAEGVEEGRDLRAAQRARPVVILATDDGAAEGAFCRVVVQRNARIVEKSRQAGPPFEHVAYGLAEVAPWEPDLHGRPLPDARDHRFRAILPELVADRLRVGVPGERTGDEPLGRIELANERPDLVAGGESLRRDVVVLPFRMRPAVREREARSVAGEDFVDGKAVGHHRAVIPREDLPTLIGRFPGQAGKSEDTVCGAALAPGPT